MKVDIYSDVACPWCYIGEARFERALAEREYGATVQRALMRRLFAAHFAEGRDVEDAGVLAALAAEVGMAADAARAYLDSDQGTREVREEIAAAQRLGVTAVPTYVFDDKYVVEGAQSSELFLQALNSVAKQAAVSDDLPITS